MIRYSILVFLACFIFSATGVSIYQNHCVKTGQSSTSIANNHACCSLMGNRQMKMSKNHACCAKTQLNNYPEHATEDCCIHTINIVKIHADVIQQDVRIELAVVPLSAQITTYTLPQNHHHQVFRPDKLLQLGSINERLSKLQRYLL